MLVLLFSIASLFAQDVELPSVTTTITGETQDIDPGALPDFTQLLPPQEDVLPQLNDSRFLPEENSLDLESDAMNEDDMYLSGFFGGGFPGLFIGDFSIFKTSLKNPFTFHFLHVAHNGYGMNLPSAGFFDSLTQLDGDATIHINDNLAIQGQGRYLANSIGLQNQSPLYSSLSSQVIESGITGILNVSKNFLLYANIDGFLVNQYGSEKTVQASIENPAYMNFKLGPSMGLAYKGAIVSYSLNADYDFSGSVQEAEYSHRGFVHGGFKTTFTILEAGFNVGGVFLKNKQLCPFTLFLSLKGQTAFSERDLVVSVSGGLESKAPFLPDLQEKHPFTLYNTLPTEQTDWFGSLNLVIPFADVVTSTIACTFNSTAFNNGILVPNYATTNTETGLFDLIVVNRNEIISDIALKYSISLCNLAVGWRSSWLDTSSIDPRQLIYLSAFIATKDSKLRSNTELEFEPMRELIPKLALGVSYTVTPSFSLSLELDDVIKLVTGTDRIIASPYVSRSGNALVTAKFYF